MRLGIRRKMIGTLMLVGLFPLVLSLVVILGGGATLKLRSIRTSYENGAIDCANQIHLAARDELNQLKLISKLGVTVEYVTRLSAERSEAITASDEALNKEWATLKPDDERLKAIMQNVLAERLQSVASLDRRHREMMVTDLRGRLIASTNRTGSFLQAGETWWDKAYNNGKGRPYVSSMVINPNPDNPTPVIEFVVPIYATKNGAEGSEELVGLLKDKVSVDWLEEPVKDVTSRFEALGQIIDGATGKTIYPMTSSPEIDRAEEHFRKYRTAPPGVWTSLFSKTLIMGAGEVNLVERLRTRYEGTEAPQWVIVISKPSEEALTDVFRVAITVAISGVALIIVLFVLGVAIANREIIMPVMRLREATAAVGRGELNVRLMSSDQKDPTFRADELGQLARDFDEMTRQLQRNVNALARGNESKRRFMELAGHELRTPITYILSACQLAQRQMQQIAAETGGEQTVATSSKTNTQIAGAMSKIASRAQRLSKIIDNLLKLVSSDQFVTKLNRSSVDMRALILQVASDARPFMQERKQQMVLDVPENLPSFEGDRDKLEDVLTNLVSNAIRFSPDGSTLKIAAHQTVGDMLEILIDDAGAGIPKEDLANLFEPFYTGSDIMHHHSGEHEYKSKGIGLGLAIVRRFVEIHGGVVKAHWTGHGTQFQILLPLTKGIANPSGPG
jgi:two-component system sensor histidine kinase BaeS